MNNAIVFSDEPVLLVGGAIGDNRQLSGLLNEFGTVVAADSGADWVMSVGRMPDLLIGDLDSVSDATRAAMPVKNVYHIAEQDSTDFDKALRSVAAPLIVGIGFLGGQVDHLLAAMTVLTRYPDRAIVLVGEQDVVCHLPPRIDLPVAAETRISLYPMCAVNGTSMGLNWPIDGLEMSPTTRVGTSNRATGAVSLALNGTGMLVILPLSQRAVLQTALTRSGGLWPAP